ncbi:R3H domain-containing protein 1-like [Pollicipes pollicipes]|uniref:R3H domain-containing protein 1-like n=1 Tax=Pollicipes pollicipes TaxID=41117 RepID=UPI0018856E61|nr:R3H domain-containing protein 1-like [Pollicipes pollicipes]
MSPPAANGRRRTLHDPKAEMALEEGRVERARLPPGHSGLQTVRAGGGAAEADMQSETTDPLKQEEAVDSTQPESVPARNGTAAASERAPLQRQSRSLELPTTRSDHGPHTLPRQKSARLKVLMRSHAMREETSPPPDVELPPRYSLSVSHKLRKFHSQGSTEGRPGSPHLSRESSSEVYTDSKGVDVEQFLVEALNANIKDQAHLLKYEQDMLNFIKDNMRAEFRFPPQSSYQRMLVHRAAVYFGLDHNVDPTGTSVIVTKTDRTRIPEHSFRDLLREDGDEPKRLLKRDGLLGHYSRSFDSQSSLDSRRSRSFEEREVEYRKARTRIFSNQQELDGDGWQSGGERRAAAWLEPADPARRQMPKAHSVDQPPRYARLNQTDSVESTNNLRVAAAADSSASSVSRLSPSSGYKTASVSQVTLDSTPSPTSQHQTGYSLEEVVRT